MQTKLSSKNSINTSTAQTSSSSSRNKHHKSKKHAYHDKDEQNIPPNHRSKKNDYQINDASTELVSVTSNKDRHTYYQEQPSYCKDYTSSGSTSAFAGVREEENYKKKSSSSSTFSTILESLTSSFKNYHSI